MTTLRILPPDTVTLKSGSPWSWTWYDEVYVPMFRSRKCDRCKEVKESIGVFRPGTTEYVTDVIFGFSQEACEEIIKALCMTSFCNECFLKLRFNRSGVPPTWSELRAKKKERTDGG